MRAETFASYGFAVSGFSLIGKGEYVCDKHLGRNPSKARSAIAR